MTTTVVGLVTTPREAETVARDLTTACSCNPSDISLITRGDDDMPAPRSGGSGALAGAIAGAVIGAIAGYFASMMALTVPVLEISLSGRPIESALAFAGAGAAIFGVLGGLFSVGRHEEDGHYYGMETRRPGTLITVHARDNNEADCVVGVMRRHGVMEIDKRSSDWAKQDRSRREEPALRPDPQAATSGLPSDNGGVYVRNHATPAPKPATATAQNPQNHNRPMEESAKASAPGHGAPVIAREQLAAGVAAKQQAAAAVDTSNWITRKYTAVYFGPERRKAANHGPYQGGERRQSA